MIDFMIIGLPRSGTTWASALFTTDKSLCYHDPLYTTHYEDWDRQLPVPGKTTGVSCTGIWRWRDWVDAHPAKKVLLHRSIDEIQQSMDEIGLPAQDLDRGEDLLSSINGLHVAYSDLFNEKRCMELWYHLMDLPFDSDRFKLFADIEMQPKFSGLSVGHSVTKRLIDELMRASE